MSKKTKEILFWVVMFIAFVTFIFSFPSCSSIKRAEQSKYITQNSVSEENVEVNGKEYITIYGGQNDTCVIVTLTPRVDVSFTSPSEIYKGINSTGYKVKEVKIGTKKTTNQSKTTTNQTQKVQTKKSADLTSAETTTTTTKTTKQHNRNILQLFIFAFCSCCGCLFYFLFKNKNNNNNLWK